MAIKTCAHPGSLARRALSTSGCFHLRTQRVGMADPASANGAPTGTNKPVKQPPIRTHVVSPSIPPLEVPPHFLQSRRFKAAKGGRGADKADGERPLQCQHPGCTASYARIEHLDRHVKTHDPSHSYRCDEVRSPSTPSPPRQFRRRRGKTQLVLTLYSRHTSAANHSRERESTRATGLASSKLWLTEFPLGSDVLQRHLKVRYRRETESRALG